MIAKKKEEIIVQQPEVNIGLIGHVDHGKTTLTERLSGKWTETHSEELKKGITIRLGYADTTLYKCPKCKDPDCYLTTKKCSNCNSDCTVLRKISFVDAPGHETLMATMLSGAAIMDGAILLVAANEDCPQPQTKEHLMALNIIGIKNIIIVQNKIDLVSEEEAMKNYEQIKKFVKGTVAENAPIIPISAQHNVNIGFLIKAIEDNIKTSLRDLTKDPLFLVARSFDVNKPGTEVNSLVGGVLGGALKCGSLEIRDKIEIRPGLKKEKEGRVLYEPIKTEIVGIKTGSQSVDKIIPGGSAGILTKLDPSIVKSDSLIGNIIGKEGKMPPIWYNFYLEPKLLEKAVGTKEETSVEPIKKGEPLMININSAVTVGIVTDLSKGKIHVQLKIPVCANKEDHVVISRRFSNRWHLIGYCKIV